MFWDGDDFPVRLLLSCFCELERTQENFRFTDGISQSRRWHFLVSGLASLQNTGKNCRDLSDRRKDTGCSVQGSVCSGWGGEEK